ncbi:hypothetical protein BHE74_00009925 [Ensete ventricosum]|uniref:Uncharacterized protein n=1 Tax=Ensete ventricosum TaxID=4639 RepID=A0A445M9W0_ENSVE|nr:hypothetical protein BHE74_00009925 [Ensete ventricosum]RZR71027.1 hypothetical protein BHM03_00002894 [Ensete ventricosum]
MFKILRDEKRGRTTRARTRRDSSRGETARRRSKGGTSGGGKPRGGRRRRRRRRLWRALNSSLQPAAPGADEGIRDAGTGLRSDSREENRGENDAIRALGKIAENTTVYIDAAQGKEEVSYTVGRNGGLVNVATGHKSDILIEIPNAAVGRDAAQAVKKMKPVEAAADIRGRRVVRREPYLVRHLGSPMAGRFGYGPSSVADSMTVVNTPSQDLALTNFAYCAPADLGKLASPGSKNALVLIGDSVVLTL